MPLISPYTMYPPTGGGGLTVPQVLTTFTSSADSGTQFETGAFTPDGSGPVVVWLFPCSGVTNNTDTVTVTLGTESRTYGTGTSPNWSRRGYRSRQQLHFYMFTNPGSSEQTIQCDWSSTPRAVGIEVWETPGSTSSQTENWAGTQQTSVSSVDDDIVTTGTASFVLYGTCRGWLGTSDVMSYSEDFDAEFTQQTTIASGGASFSDCDFRGAYEANASATTKNYTCSWTSAANAIMISQEIDP